VLLTRWTATLERLGADGPGPIEGAGRAAGLDLLSRYAEPQRRYHDQRHLLEVLEAVDLLAGSAVQPDVVRLAAWFHDAVYDPQTGPGANEEASARLAEDVLASLQVPVTVGARVGALVRSTATHEVPAGDVDAAMLCDADLAILGSDPGRYAEYAVDVRLEYAFAPDEVFRPARAAILASFADREQIYRTEAGTARYEARARINLAAELARLTAG
jgi:predicted metal-dependent HD superfamily phosphohydrolase